MGRVITLLVLSIIAINLPVILWDVFKAKSYKEKHLKEDIEAETHEVSKVDRPSKGREISRAKPNNGHDRPAVLDALKSETMRERLRNQKSDPGNMNNGLTDPEMVDELKAQFLDRAREDFANALLAKDENKANKDYDLSKYRLLTGKAGESLGNEQVEPLRIHELADQEFRIRCADTTDRIAFEQCEVWKRNRKGIIFFRVLRGNYQGAQIDLLASWTSFQAFRDCGAVDLFDYDATTIRDLAGINIEPWPSSGERVSDALCPRRKPAPTGSSDFLSLASLDGLGSAKTREDGILWMFAFPIFSPNCDGQIKQNAFLGRKTKDVFFMNVNYAEKYSAKGSNGCGNLKDLRYKFLVEFYL